MTSRRLATRFRRGIGRPWFVGVSGRRGRRHQPGVEVIGKFNRRAVSIRHPLEQTPQANSLELARYRIVDLAGRLRVAVQDLVEIAPRWEAINGRRPVRPS